MKINVVLGDITQFDGDAIVNAANERMLGGGGVDGVIHRAAGPQLLAECEKVPEVRPGVRCQTGEARITSGGNLKAKWVIHTVGPVYRDGKHGEPEKLAACYRNSLQLAVDNGIRSIAFPSISTGVYGYPVEGAATIAVREVRRFLSVHPEMSVTFVCFNGPRDKMDVKEVYERLLAGESQSVWDPHGNVTAFMDAGETYGLVCVEPATADRSAVIEARGSKGTVKFTFKYGREGHDVRCRVVGKNAVLRSPSLEFLHLELNEDQAKCLRKGDVIKVPSTMNGLVWIRDNYKCPLGNGREIRSLAGFASELAHRWIDVNGAVISEPAWTHTLLAFKLLYGYQNWTRQNGGGCRGYDEFTLVKLVLDAYAKILTEENALDFEGGFEDLELACDTIRHAAKSINRHVKKGDFKPNQEKIYEFDRLVSVDQLRRLSAKSDFATELLRCAEQVNHSRANGFREMVDVVREYSPLRYPNTRVRIEPL